MFDTKPVGGKMDPRLYYLEKFSVDSRSSEEVAKEAADMLAQLSPKDRKKFQLQQEQLAEDGLDIRSGEAGAAFTGDVIDQYLRGMQWVIRYYTEGNPSWLWHYPYHYAPLASDMLLRYAILIQSHDLRRHRRKYCATGPTTMQLKDVPSFH